MASVQSEKATQDASETEEAEVAVKEPGLRDRKKAEVTKRILETAQRVFIARGVHEADLADIARGAQISRATLYRYFDGKEALLTALIEDGWDRQASLFQRLVSDLDLGAASIDRWLRTLVKAASASRSSLPIYVAIGQTMDLGLALRRHRSRLMDILEERFSGFSPASGRGRIEGVLMLVQIEQFAIYAAQSDDAKAVDYGCELLVKQLTSRLR